MAPVTDSASRMNPVFVVGMNGSGTTMLLDRLDRHPDLFGFPVETKLLPHYLTTLPRSMDLNDDATFLKLFFEMGRAFPFLLANNGLPLKPPASWRSLQRSAAAIFDTIMREFASRRGKSRWCEKTPMHVQHITLLSAAFPAAQFIHVIRDGRDCAASFHRRWGYTPQSTIYRWKCAIRDGRLQGAPLGSHTYMEVFYERLTKFPEDELRRICSFLAVAYSRDLTRADRDTSRVKGLADLEIVENSGRYKSYFKPHQLLALERIAGATLASLGYDTSQPLASSDPPFLQRQLWRSADRFRFAARYLINKLRSPQPIPWRLLAMRLRHSWRQMRAERF